MDLDLQHGILIRLTWLPVWPLCVYKHKYIHIQYTSIETDWFDRQGTPMSGPPMAAAPAPHMVPTSMAQHFPYMQPGNYISLS